MSICYNGARQLSTPGNAAVATSSHAAPPSGTTATPTQSWRGSYTMPPTNTARCSARPLSGGAGPRN
eukprot:3915002-Lingulodinium_polyedra.AAC.1